MCPANGKYLHPEVHILVRFARQPAVFEIQSYQKSGKSEDTD